MSFPIEMIMQLIETVERAIKVTLNKAMVTKLRSSVGEK